MIRIYRATDLEKEIIRDVETATFLHFKQKDIFITEVNIVAPEEIQEMNNNLRGIDKVTDVLSFPDQDIKGNLPVKADDFGEGEKEDGKVILGTICICREKAEEQAKEYGHSVEREVGFLTVHGLLHLLGFDHIEEKDETVMRAHQTQILELAGLGIKG